MSKENGFCWNILHIVFSFFNKVLSCRLSDQLSIWVCVKVCVSRCVFPHEIREISSSYFRWLCWPYLIKIASLRLDIYRGLPERMLSIYALIIISFTTGSSHSIGLWCIWMTSFWMLSYLLDRIECGCSVLAYTKECWKKQPSKLGSWVYYWNGV